MSQDTSQDTLQEMRTKPLTLEQAKLVVQNCGCVQLFTSWGIIKGFTTVTELERWKDRLHLKVEL